MLASFGMRTSQGPSVSSVVSANEIADLIEFGMPAEDFAWLIEQKARMAKRRRQPLDTEPTFCFNEAK